nr:baseplate J/gp47 family protein [Lachnospiraceae bacterium]
ELEEVYNNLEVADLNGSILTCDRDHLIIFGVENGVPIKSATCAVWLAEFNVDFEVGERFEAGDLTYISVDKVAEKKYYLKCETAGTAGNIEPDDELLPIEFIEEYDTGELVKLIEPAVDAEETEAYRMRLLEERKQENVISGNRADYKKFIKSLSGVGGIKQERVTQDCKRIKTYVISSTWGKPSDDIIEAVQQVVDPKDSQGDGEGMAPFFHVVDILPVETKRIDISANIELLPGYSFEMVSPDVEEAIEQYFTELNKGWEETEKNGLIIRVLKIADAIAGVEGVADVSDLLLNGQDRNMELDRNAIPVRGDITNVD